MELKMQIGCGSRWLKYLGMVFVFIVTTGLLFITGACGSPNTAEKDFENLLVLSDGWKLQAAAHSKGTGESISTPEFNSDGWYPVTVPSTVLAGLVKNGVYKDIYMGKNLEDIPKEQFNKSWWYRKEFNIDDHSAVIKNTRLIFEGINYKANVWLNGLNIHDSKTLEGAYRIFDLDVTQFIKPGKNVLAVEIIPPKKGDLTIGWVDWNPWPPDQNMGIWREVKLRRSGAVSVNDVFVQTTVDLETLADATLTVTANLKNHTAEAVSCVVKGTIEDISFSRDCRLEPNESREVSFRPDTFKELNIKNPRLWWPNNLGKPELYSATLTVSTGKVITDEQSVRFGIREVSDYVNEGGHRGYKVNGKKVLIRGAAWVDDLLLANDDKKVKAQMEYAKHLNLNALRLEGFWGSNKTLYNLADENGLLLMVGLSCHWEWENYCGRPETTFMCVDTPEDIELQARSYGDQVTWLRNHPSIFVWVFGSDKLPSPEFEKRLKEYITEADTTRPLLGACKYKVFLDKSPFKEKDEFDFQVGKYTGPTRVKMLGPWDYVPPVYWFIDQKYGGAYGFNTETGPGPQPLPLESLKRMIPEEHLWPINEYWDYHCGRNEFNTIKRYMTAFTNRYWKPGNVEEFSRDAQIASYEAMRPMFEAFGVNKHNATGVIQWMFNSAWPEMFWQLFDYYLMPSGAFYAARKANQPVNIAYNYGDKNIYIVNDLNEPVSNMNAEVKMVSLEGKTVFNKEVAVKVGANVSEKILDLPKFNGPGNVYFVALKLKDAEANTVADNFYWLSQKQDVMDYPGTIWLYTPSKEYADFSDLKKLEAVSLDVTHKIETEGSRQKVSVTLKNPTDKVAFFVELKVAGNKSGNTILPVLWDDNYVSLLPGEEKQINAYFDTENLNGEQPVFSYSGFNVKR